MITPSPRILVVDEDTRELESDHDKRKAIAYGLIPADTSTGEIVNGPTDSEGARVRDEAHSPTHPRLRKRPVVLLPAYNISDETRAKVGLPLVDRDSVPVTI